MNVYIVRHGETQSNLDKRFQGSLPVPLTPAGEEQAKRLGAWLRRAEIDGVVSSPALRAVQTAEILACCLGRTDSIVLAPALAEIDCGAWQGKTFAEVELEDPETFSGWRSGSVSFCFPQGENLVGVRKRVGRFFDTLVEKRAGENLILVSHGAAITMLLTHVLKLDPGEAWQTGHLIHKNTAVTRLELNPRTREVVASVVAQTDHL